MKNLLGQSWLTTVIGWAGGIGNLAIDAIQTGATTPKSILLSIILALLGTAAKTFNVSGK